jgi:hypothetical protein
MVIPTPTVRIWWGPREGNDPGLPYCFPPYPAAPQTAAAYGESEAATTQGAARLRAPDSEYRQS